MTIPHKIIAALALTFAFGLGAAACGDDGATKNTPAATDKMEDKSADKMADKSTDKMEDKATTTVKK